MGGEAHLNAKVELEDAAKALERNLVASLQFASRIFIPCKFVKACK